MKPYIFAIALMLIASPTTAQQRPQQKPLSAEAQDALAIRDFNALGQDYAAESEGRRAAETELSGAQVTIAKQKAKLDWWAKTWPSKRKSDPLR